MKIIGNTRFYLSYMIFFLFQYLQKDLYIKNYIRRIEVFEKVTKKQMIFSNAVNKVYDIPLVNVTNNISEI